jgi:TRAP-type C4-dicarboxylate transport system substrate-binding protein
MLRETIMAKALISAAAAVLLLGAQAFAQEKITLRVADHYSPDHTTAKYTIKFFMDRVKELTNGKVSFQYYPSEQLGKARDMLSLTQRGVVDIGLVAAAYIPEKMPLSAVAELPGTYSKSCQGNAAYWKLSREGVLAEKEFKPNGIRPLITFVLPPYQIMLRGALNGLNDIRGQKLRSGGTAQDIAIKALGAVPVRMAGPEVYEALSRGTLDGIVFPLQATHEFKLDKLVKTGTLNQNFGGFATTYSISEANWSKLPPDVQKAFDQASEETVKHACAALDADNSGPAAETLKKAGVNLRALSSDDDTKARELLRPVQEEWAKGLDARGLPGSDVLNIYLAAIAAGS